MSDLLGGRAVRALLATHGVRPRKQLGQNFVIDPNTIRKVVDAASISPGDVILEVGAGVGSLTLGLASVAEKVIAVEKDPRLIETLGESLAGLANVEVRSEDILHMDLASIEATKVVANLPYNIAATTVLKVLEEAPQIGAMTVMTQREVGERLAASVGNKAYGAPSVLVSYWADTKVVTKVGRGAFYPQPEVESVLVTLERRKRADVDYAVFRSTVRAAFSQRRKTLRNALVSLVGDPSTATRALEESGIDPLERAERVDLSGFARLATVLHRLGVSA